MFTIYVLKDKNGLYYKGFTNDLERRLKEHRLGKTFTTKKMIDFEVVYTEKAETRIEARKREKYLKSAAGRRYLKSIGIMGP